MAEQGGVSEARVHQIAQNVVHPVTIRVNALTGEVDHLKARVKELEDEMGQMVEVLRSVNANIANGFSRLIETSAAIRLAQEAGTVATVAGFDATIKVSSKGFETLSQDMQVVGGTLEQMSQATVEMEIVRQMHEVKGPRQRAVRFQEEIEQRFAKAEENVHEVRKQYDALQFRATDELDKKLRQIGSHIYQVLEEDFEVSAEEPLSRPFDETLALALTVDLDAIQRRSVALEGALDDLGDNRLVPLLSAQADLEHLLTSKYSVQGATAEAYYIPVSVVEARSDGERVVGVFADERLRPGQQTQDSVDLDLTMTADGEEVASRTQDLIEARFASLPKHEIRQDERNEIVAALNRMASDGRILRELLPGYLALLEQSPLRVIDQGESHGS